MQTVSTGYRQAVQQAEQKPATRVRVDWDGNGVYTDVDTNGVTVERTITSDLPGEVTLISGVTAATATVNLAGSPTDPSRDAGMLYSPYQTASPLYGVDVEGAPARVDMGLQVGEAPEYLTQLAGRVRDLTVSASSAGADASMQVVDGRQDFRFPPVLPLAVAADATGSLQPGLDAQWIVSAIARQAGYNPVPRSFTATTSNDGALILSAPMHGSVLPDPTGTAHLLSAQTASAGVMQFEEGAPYGLALSADPVDGSLGIAEYTTTQFWLGGTQEYLHIEMWIRPSVSSYTAGDITVTNGASTSTVRLANNGANYILRLIDSVDITGPAVTSPSLWHFVGVFVQWDNGATQLVITWNIDGVITGPTAPGLSNPLIPGGGPSAVRVKTFNATQAVQVVRKIFHSGPTLTADWGYGFTQTAVLEPSLSAMTATPAIAPTTDAWSIIQDIAKATAGVATLDERGVFQFWNRRHFTTAAASTVTQRTVRASMPITNIQVQRLADRIRNVVQATVTPYQVGPVAILWGLSDVVQVPAHGTITRIVDLSPAQGYQIDTLGSVTVGGGPLVNGRSSYRAARQKNGTGGAVTNLTMTVTPTAASVIVAVYNPNKYPVWLVSPTGAGYPTASNGLPSVSVVGRVITQGATDPDTSAAVAATTSTVEYRDGVSIASHGARPVVLDASVWLQSSDDALALATDVCEQISQPQPQWPPVTIVADPALQVGDKVWVVDDSGITGINDPAWIVGITTRTDASGATQDLLLRPVAPPGALILDDPDRGTLDGRWRWG